MDEHDAQASALGTRLLVDSPAVPGASPRFSHLRVLHLGDVARFSQLVPHAPLDAATWRAQLRTGADLVLVEPPEATPDWDPLGGELPAALRAARELGIPSLRLSTQASGGGPGTPTLEAVETSPGTLGGGDRDMARTLGVGEAVAPSIDESRFHPFGWRPRPPDAVVAVLHRAPDAAAAALLAAFDPPVVLVHPGDLPSVGEFGLRRSVSTPAGLRRSLIRAGVLLDHPGWRGDVTETLRLWTAALACGTPVVVVEPAGGIDSLGLPVPPGVLVRSTAEVVESVHRLLVDPDLRERLGIVGRRWALRDGARETALRTLLGHLDVPVPEPPRTTVLLATNRPAFLERGLASVARQRRAGVDISLVLHGEAFDALDAPDRDGLVSSVVRAPGWWRLGDCLNAALDEARGELVAKMDDDDHYGPDHLDDLVTALSYSGADLVGKRVEYVYLAERGLTIRRPASRPERDRQHVGGPTLLGRRDLLRRHRFLRLPNREDSTLYERVRATGGRIYGIHSRDLVLERHGGGHAWQAADEEFLAEAVVRRAGLALDLATSDPTVGT